MGGFSPKKNLGLFFFAPSPFLGVQTALVIVAWLVGFSRTRRALLIVVYAVTAVVSIAFSYVQPLYWFSVRERPALVERQLYDTLNSAAQKTEEILSPLVRKRANTCSRWKR